MTGGRIRRIKDLIGNEDFMLTYGDGVADINIDSLIKYHKQNNKHCFYNLQTVLELLLGYKALFHRNQV